MLDQLLLWLLYVVVAFCVLCVWWLSTFKDPSSYTAYLQNDKHQCVDWGKKKFAVIGAGFCGLGVAAALKRHKIPFQSFESTGSIGGNWSHGVYETVHIISSKKTTEYKDFPMPESYPDFPSRHQMLAYLKSYAAHYKLEENIKFNTEVKAVKPAANDDGYDLTFSDGSTQRFHGVIICNGHHWDSKMGGPYSGSDSFTGVQMHSKQYKSPDILKDKRVLTLGAGNSACDIAVEAGRFALTSHVSVRNGAWYLPRVLFGRPAVEIIFPWMPIWMQRLFIRIALRIVVGKYSDYGLPEPTHQIWDRHPTINSELLSYCKLGRVIPHPDIKRFLGGKKVEFIDGTVEEFDLIVHATGYHVSVPILDNEILRWERYSGAKDDGRTYPQNLVQGMVHRYRKNLFVFGLGQPRYGAGPLITAGAEMAAYFLEAQTKMKYPLGLTLVKLGAKPLENYLGDPHVVFKSALRAISLSKYFPTIEKWLVKPPAN